MNNKNKGFLDIVNKYDWMASLGILVILIFLMKENLIIIYDKDVSIIDNIISVSGTLFGFWITCLSMFIIFKTDDKYTKETTSRSLGKLLSNDKFNDFYLLFIKDLFCIGTVLLLSFAIYFLVNINIQIKIIFIIIYLFLICLSIIRTIISLLAFKKIINIIINSKQS